MLVLLQAGGGLEAGDEFGSDLRRQSLDPLGDNSEKAQGDFLFYAHNLSHTGLC